jgi:hypothetical protein
LPLAPLQSRPLPSVARFAVATVENETFNRVVYVKGILGVAPLARHYNFFRGYLSASYNVTVYFFRRLMGGMVNLNMLVTHTVLSGFSHAKTPHS